jgi:hypothetical protein
MPTSVFGPKKEGVPLGLFDLSGQNATMPVKPGYFGGGAGFTLNWSEYGPAIGVSTYREEKIKSNIVRASQYTAEKIVNSNAGQLIATQYS